MGMNTYQRIFGTGPRGFFLSLVLLALARLFAPLTPLSQITSNVGLTRVIFISCSLVTIVIVFWSIQSLPLSGGTILPGHDRCSGAGSNIMSGYVRCS